MAFSLTQPAYNLIDTECSSVLDEAVRRGVGVLVGGPYKVGYLSERYQKMEDFSTEDCYWEWNLPYNRSKVQATLEKANGLLAEAGGARQLRHMALDHILKKPAVGSAIVGHREEAEVTDNADIVEHLKATP